MIISVIHIDDFENNELHHLIERSDKLQNHALLTDIPLQNKFAEILSNVSDKVICFNGVETNNGLTYQNQLIQNSRNSPSIFSVSKVHYNDTIITVDPSFICDDWDKLSEEITEAIRISQQHNVFVAISSRNILGPDLSVAWCNNNHFIANVNGYSVNSTILNYAKERAETYNHYYPIYSGICVFPSGILFHEIEKYMPRYNSWIRRSKWNLVQRLSFEESVLENLPSFHRLHSNTLITPIKHYHQIFEYIKHKNNIDNFPIDHWQIIDAPGEYEFAFRFVESHQTKIELLPGIYYKHGMKVVRTLNDIIFTVENKDYRKFERHVTLMRVRKK